ncbi:hypothetical protein BRC96_10575 [Halobacteriales archaeon QS_6_64_34]|nr:MAG: hypothetical protein BRC96_10575 [Halobacteriales archaeon QS_6_64_34]
MVLIDDIRITDSEPVSGATKRSQKFRQLHRNFGRLDERVVDEQREGYEEGSLVFTDGTSVPFTYQVLDDRIENTIDGETFVLQEI